MATTPTQKTSELDLNKINETMRSQPWYIEWFRSKGLNPNFVKLNEQLRQELTMVAAQNGMPLGDRMKFDEAGNVNQQGGWAGMPTWAKAAIGAGAAIGTGGILGVTGVLGGLGSGAASGGGLGGAATSSATGSTIGGLSGGGAMLGGGAATGIGAGTVGTAAAGGGGLFSAINKYAPLAVAGGRMLGAVGQAQANNRGAEIETRFAHDALQLAEASDRRNRETDDYRKSLYGQLAEGYQPSNRPEGIENRYPNGFITDKAREAGSLMTQIAMARLRNPEAPIVDPYSSLPTKPGTMETIANYAGPALSLFDPRTYGRY